VYSFTIFYPINQLAYSRLPGVSEMWVSKMMKVLKRSRAV